MSFWSWLEGKEASLIDYGPSLTLRGSQIFDILKDRWSKFTFDSLRLSDDLYVTLSLDDISKILFESQIERYVHTSQTIGADSGLFDCDDFSLLLHAYVIKKRYQDFQNGLIPKNRLFPLAFGQCWGDFGYGNHAINIAITHDLEIILIEPQQDKKWKATKGLNVNYVRL